MASANMRRFEDKLIEGNLITPQQLSQIKASKDYLAKGLFESLLNQKSILLDQLYQLASQIWSVPVMQLSERQQQPEPSCKVPLQILVQLDALVLEDNENDIVFGDPEKLERISQLGFYTQHSFNPALADIHVIRKLNHQLSTGSASTEPDEPQQNTLEKYISKSAQHNASDIHLEMYREYCRVRFRVDGVLHPLASLTCKQGLKLISQIKLLANMDIAQSRRPQDGRMSQQLQDQAISLRVNSIPTINGEKLVLRILEQHGKQFKLDQIGLFNAQYRLVREIIKQPSGMLLVCGPTGSGKTVTLYALLALLNTGKENISTIEDPAEIHVEGINQVSINRKAGVDFSTALRALLRQDPDIIMIGEIRDAETAEIAVKAAQTGHLVLATVHSRTALSAQTRLSQLGISQYLLEDTLRLTIAQRLVRRLCEKCRTAAPPSNAEAELFMHSEMAVPKQIHQPLGCPDCLQGYLGRMGIFELLAGTQTAARQPGEHHDMRRSGLRHVAAGTTSMAELLRVL